MKLIMGTKNHSRASKERWADIPKDMRSQRMSNVAKAGWESLDEKARRRRALKGRRTRLANVVENE